MVVVVVVVDDDDHVRGDDLHASNSFRRMSTVVCDKSNKRRDVNDAARGRWMPRHTQCNRYPTTHIGTIGRIVGERYFGCERSGAMQRWCLCKAVCKGDRAGKSFGRRGSEREEEKGGEVLLESFPCWVTWGKSETKAEAVGGSVQHASIRDNRDGNTTDEEGLHIPEGGGEEEETCERRASGIVSENGGAPEVLTTQASSLSLLFFFFFSPLESLGVSFPMAYPTNRWYNPLAKRAA